MLLSIITEAFVEPYIKDGDSNKESRKGNWGAGPVNNWVHGIIGIEESKVVGEYVEESVECHQFPISCNNLDIREVNIDPCHDQRSSMDHNHMKNHKVIIKSGRPVLKIGGPAYHIHENRHENTPKAESNGQIKRV